MAAQDYAKLKNAELEALLKQRGLQTGGKKADMVARLQAADAETGEAAPETTVPSSSGEKAEEKPSPEVAAPATTQAAAAAKDEQSDQPANAADAPKDSDKKLTREERDAERAAKRAEDEKKFGQGMNATDIDAEIARRKRRAEKWGLPMNAEAEDGIKALERAKKFGTVAAGGGELAQDAGEGETKTVLGLDSALPERQRKRGRDESSGGRGGKRARGGRSAGTTGGAQSSKTGGADWMSEADRAKAEARKAKWATAT